MKDIELTFHLTVVRANVEHEISTGEKQSSRQEERKDEDEDVNLPSLHMSLGPGMRPGHDHAYPIPPCTPSSLTLTQTLAPTGSTAPRSPSWNELKR